MENVEKVGGGEVEDNEKEPEGKVIWENEREEGGRGGSGDVLHVMDPPVSVSRPTFRTPKRRKRGSERVVSGREIEGQTSITEFESPLRRTNLQLTPLPPLPPQPTPSSSQLPLAIAPSLPSHISALSRFDIKLLSVADSFEMEQISEGDGDEEEEREGGRRKKRKRRRRAVEEAREDGGGKAEVEIRQDMEVEEDKEEGREREVEGEKKRNVGKEKGSQSAQQTKERGLGRGGGIQHSNLVFELFQGVPSSHMIWSIHPLCPAFPFKLHPAMTSPACPYSIIVDLLLIILAEEESAYSNTHASSLLSAFQDKDLDAVATRMNRSGYIKWKKSGRSSPSPSNVRSNRKLVPVAKFFKDLTLPPELCDDVTQDSCFTLNSSEMLLDSESKPLSALSLLSLTSSVWSGMASIVLESSIAAKTFWTRDCPYLVRCPTNITFFTHSSHGALTPPSPSAPPPSLTCSLSVVDAFPSPSRGLRSLPLEDFVLREVTKSGEMGLAFAEIFGLWTSSQDTPHLPSCSFLPPVSSHSPSYSWLLSARDSLTAAVKALCERQEIACVLAFDHHRYVVASFQHIKRWVVSNGEEEVMCVRPWIGIDRQPKKERFLTIFWKLVRCIWKSPGISRDDLILQFPLLSPVHIHDFLSYLEEQRIIRHVCTLHSHYVGYALLMEESFQECHLTSHGDTHLHPPLCILLDGSNDAFSVTDSLSPSLVVIRYIPLFPSFPLTPPWDWERAASEMLRRYTFARK